MVSATMLVVFVLVGMFCGCIGAHQEEVDCRSIADRKQSQLCILNQSVSRLSVSGCDDILDKDIKIQCIDEIAVRIGEYYTCEAHDRRADRDKCVEKVGQARKAKRSGVSQSV
jgi:hypothetical protein